MSTIERIVERKKREVELLEDIDTLPVCDRDFVGGLRGHHPFLIAEVKPASPSEGNIIDRRNAPAIVEVYNRYAQAISVLCDQPDFGGGYDLLEHVRELTDLPILAKEFIIDVKQVRRARQAGADAILLIASILDEARIAELCREAVDLGMAVLFEMHHGTELGLIPFLPADTMVIGVNNRNLSTLEIDIDMTEVISLNIRSGFPDYVFVSESGIRTRGDVERLSLSADGFLIGSTLLRAKNIDSVILDLFPNLGG